MVSNPKIFLKCINDQKMYSPQKGRKGTLHYVRIMYPLFHYHFCLLRQYSRLVLRVHLSVHACDPNTFLTLLLRHVGGQPAFSQLLTDQKRAVWSIGNTQGLTTANYVFFFRYASLKMKVSLHTSRCILQSISICNLRYMKCIEAMDTFG